MNGIREHISCKRLVRLWTRIGLFCYLSSFFFLSPSAQKTLFYLFVASPCIFLLTDLKYLLREKCVQTTSVLLFVSYFSFSSLWSEGGDLLYGMKVVLCITCLLVAIHSSMNLCYDSGVVIHRFIVIVGACAICFYSYLIIHKAIDSENFNNLFVARYSLRDFGGIGDDNPINTAIYLGVTVLASWHLFPQCRPLNKLGLLVLSVTSMNLMFLTQSRGPLISLTITLFLVSATRRCKDDLILWGGTLAICVVSTLLLDIMPSITERVNAPDYRLDIWSRAVGLIKENPLFGQGYGDSANIAIRVYEKDVFVTHSHSSIIETFRVGGLIGGFIFIAMILSNTRIRPKTASVGQCFFLSWLFFGLLCLSTNGRLPFIRPSVEWFAFWIPLFLTALTPGGSSTDRKRDEKALPDATK
jgi:O-antigen ligase